MSVKGFAKSRGFAVLAVLVVGTAIGVLAMAGNTSHNKEPGAHPSQKETLEQPEATSREAVPVVLTAAREMAFEDRISVSGSLRAKHYAMVSARVPGTLDEVYVDEGDRVEAGKTRLFQTDAVKLNKAVAIARQNLAVAEATVWEKEALLEKSKATESQAQNDLHRYRKLLEKDAIAAQLAEQQESKCRECEADVKHTAAIVDLSKAQREQARIQVAMAEKDLADSLVVAPISGRVSQRFREPGEMAAAGTAVLRIEDLTVLEVSVFLPEEYYAKVITDKTKMRVRVGNADLGERNVSYKSPTVHTKLRTFEVRGLIVSPAEGVVPGCLAKVAIATDLVQGVGIPSGAVQIRGGRPVIFTVVDGKAKLMPVEVGRDMDGWREVLGGLAPGTKVISMGQFLVDEGTPVSIVREAGR